MNYAIVAILGGILLIELLVLYCAMKAHDIFKLLLMIHNENRQLRDDKFMDVFAQIIQQKMQQERSNQNDNTSDSRKDDDPRKG